MTMFRGSRAIIAPILAVMLPLLAQPVCAQSYPSQPVQLVVGYAQGVRAISSREFSRRS